MGTILLDYLVPSRTRQELVEFTRLFHQKKIALVGGTGLIGRWILEIFSYLDAGRWTLPILVTGRSRPKWLLDEYGPVSVIFQHLDINCEVSTASFLDSCGFCPAIIFLAAPSASETSCGMGGLEKYSLALRSGLLLQRLQECCAASALLVASSGVSVQSESKLWSEDEKGAPALFAPNESLAHGKRAIERAAFELALSRDVAVGVARIFSCFGPHLPTDLHYVLGNFLGHARGREPLIIKSSGNSTRSFVYASDLVASLLELLKQLTERRPGSFDVLNLGSENAVSIKALANLILTVSGQSQNALRILGEEEESKGNRVRANYVPDVAKAKALGIYRERVSLLEGLQMELEKF